MFSNELDDKNNNILSSHAVIIISRFFARHTDYYFTLYFHPAHKTQMRFHRMSIPVQQA